MNFVVRIILFSFLLVGVSIRLRIFPTWGTDGLITLLGGFRAIPKVVRYRRAVTLRQYLAYNLLDPPQLVLGAVTSRPCDVTADRYPGDRLLRIDISVF